MRVLGPAAATFIVLALLLCGCAEEPSGEPTFAQRIDSADELFRTREYEEAGALFEEIADEALAAGDMSAYVEACALRARSFLIRGMTEEGRPWLAKAEAYATEESPRGWSRFLGERGRFEWKDRNLEAATQTFKEMFDYCEAHELYDRAIDAAHMVAIAGSDEDKFEWSRRGIEMAEAGGLTGWLGPLWNNLGWNYYEEGLYDEARDALEKARDYHYMGENELPKLIADYSVGHVMRMQGELDESKGVMQDVLDWATRLNDDGNPDALEWMGFSRWELGEIAMAEGDTDSGVALLEKALEELESAGMPRWDGADWQKKQERLKELRP